MIAALRCARALRGRALCGVLLDEKLSVSDEAQDEAAEALRLVDVFRRRERGARGGAGGADACGRGQRGEDDLAQLRAQLGRCGRGAPGAEETNNASKTNPGVAKASDRAVESGAASGLRCGVEGAQHRWRAAGGAHLPPRPARRRWLRAPLCARLAAATRSPQQQRPAAAPAQPTAPRRRRRTAAAEPAPQRAQTGRPE
jgi:hypothetical protein